MTSSDNNSKRVPTGGETASTGSDEGSKSSKGSNHHLGAAFQKKLSSPIGDKFRKMVRKSDSALQESDHSASVSARGTPTSDKKKAFAHHRYHTDGGSPHNPMKEVADFFGEGGKHIKRLVHHKGSKSRDDFSSTTSRGISDDEDRDSEDLPAVPPDDTLQKMNVIINRRLKDISIPNYYAAAWSGDTTGNEQEPLYRSFLEESGKENIIVGQWEVAEEGKEFIGDWDGEKFTHKRTVTFVFDKKIPMQSKPVVAQVKQTHYCRVEGNDKCVVAMTIEMQGVPFSDCFNVEIRWVAIRSGANDIAVQVGLFVNFIKSTMLSGKIRSGTTQQTTQQQLQLFEKVQQACGGVVEEVSEDEGEETPQRKTVTKLTPDEAGRILVLSGCLLLLVSQAKCLFTRNSNAITAQMQMMACSVTSILAGFMILVPNVCQLAKNECLLVVVAHLVQGLCVSFASDSSVVTALSTVLLMAAWAVLAWGVWRQGTPAKAAS